MGWFIAALENYAVFEGRSGRKEYWYFALFSGTIARVLLSSAVRDGTPGRNRFGPDPKATGA